MGHLHASGMTASAPNQLDMLQLRSSHRNFVINIYTNTLDRTSPLYTAVMESLCVSRFNPRHRSLPQPPGTLDPPPSVYSFLRTRSPTSGWKE